MKINSFALVALSGVAAFTFAGSAQAQLVVETTNFITSPTNTNGFEGLGSITGSDGVVSYSENGISVDYIGDIPSGGIWSESQTAAEGQYSWYPDGGGFGYTRITFADTNQIEFRAGSGFFLPPVFLFYDVLLNGVSVGTGLAGPLPTFEAGFVFYGFSGTLFDEVRIQGRPEGAAFDPAAFEALAIDAIQLGNVNQAIPEPASWAMMIAGFGLVGAAMRRRKIAVAYA